MDVVEIVSAIGYVTALALLCLFASQFALKHRRPRLDTPIALLLAAMSAWGGSTLAMMVTPDWNPLSMLLAFIPFWAITTWALIFARFVQQAPAAINPGKRALLWTIPGLALAPVGGLIGVNIGGILTLAAAIFVIRRKTLTKSPAAM